MRHTGRRSLSFIAKIMTLGVILLICSFGMPFLRFLPDVTGEIRVQSAILEQKLESSQRLEVTTVSEEGNMVAETSVILFGTVGSTSIRYRYTASIGIDLSKVIMTTDSDRIIFTLPEPEILNDGIEALEINRHDFFSKAIDKSVESLLSEQRLKCREQYLMEKQHSDRIWEDVQKAFSDTICQWLSNFGERHYDFEFHRMDDTAAGIPAVFSCRKPDWEGSVCSP